MAIKPISTHYNNYYFRSRLEARWAVFFDEMGIDYQYEVEGFELSSGVWYLPDFKLYDCWLEVKHRDEDNPKTIKNIKELVIGLRVDAVIVWGDPLDDLVVRWQPHFLLPGCRRILSTFLHTDKARESAIKARQARF